MGNNTKGERFNKINNTPNWIKLKKNRFPFSKCRIFGQNGSQNGSEENPQQEGTFLATPKGCYQIVERQIRGRVVVNIGDLKIMAQY